MTAGSYNFLSLIVNIILLSLALTLSTLPVAKTQFFIHLSFNSTLRLINRISSDIQILHRYFNGTAIVEISRVPFAAAVIPIKLVLYLKDLKLLLYAMALLKLVASP